MKSKIKIHKNCDKARNIKIKVPSFEIKTKAYIFKNMDKNRCIRQPIHIDFDLFNNNIKEIFTKVMNLATAKAVQKYIPDKISLDNVYNGGFWACMPTSIYYNIKK